MLRWNPSLLQWEKYMYEVVNDTPLVIPCFLKITPFSHFPNWFPLSGMSFWNDNPSSKSLLSIFSNFLSFVELFWMVLFFFFLKNFSPPFFPSLLCSRFSFEVLYGSLSFNADCDASSEKNNKRIYLYWG